MAPGPLPSAIALFKFSAPQSDHRGALRLALSGAGDRPDDLLVPPPLRKCLVGTLTALAALKDWRLAYAALPFMRSASARPISSGMTPMRG